MPDDKNPLQEKYRQLVLELKRLRGAQGVLVKLGSIPPRTNVLETKIFGQLKTIKPILSTGKAFVLAAHFADIERDFAEYHQIITLANHILTPQLLEQQLTEQSLNETEILALARYLSTSYKHSSEDSDKLTLLLSSLAGQLAEAEYNEQLADFFNPLPQFSAIDQGILAQIRSLNEEVAALNSLADVLSQQYLAEATRLIQSLGVSGWHYQVMRLRYQIEQLLKERQTILIEHEKDVVIQAGQYLLSIGVDVLSKADETGKLKIEVALRLANKFTDPLSADYKTYLPKLPQLVQIGLWLRQALEVITAQMSPPIAEPPVESLPAERPVPTEPVAVLSPLTLTEEGISEPSVSPSTPAFLRSITRPTPIIPDTPFLVDGLIFMDDLMMSNDEPTPVSEPVAAPTPAPVEQTTTLPASPPKGEFGKVKLAPVFLTAPTGNVVTIEKHLSERSGEIIQSLGAKPRPNSTQVIKLQHSALLLSPIEVSAFVGTNNNNGLSYQQKELVKRSLILAAELQENLAIFDEKSMRGSESPTITYLLEQSQHCVQELASASRIAQQQHNMELSFNLNSIHNKLLEAYRNWASKVRLPR